MYLIGPYLKFSGWTNQHRTFHFWNMKSLYYISIIIKILIIIALLIVIMVWRAKQTLCEVRVCCCNQKFRFTDLTKWFKCRIGVFGIVPTFTLKGQFYNIINNLTDIDLGLTWYRLFGVPSLNLSYKSLLPILSI